LTSETRGLISAARISHMRAGAILINVSRGGLVDEVAAAAALREGQLGGVGLDVFETEPLPPGHPLRVAPRVVLTPHVAWRSNESSVELQLKASEQLGFALRGQPMPNALNREVYELGAEARRQKPAQTVQNTDTGTRSE
jgi:D-3-phosphoglycerate dehydrogenase / 2-oxoglutarate reductase